MKSKYAHLHTFDKTMLKNLYLFLLDFGPLTYVQCDFGLCAFVQDSCKTVNASCDKLTTTVFVTEA